jgi:uncharacterized protein (TIRG00374 family)
MARPQVRRSTYRRLGVVLGLALGLFMLVFAARMADPEQVRAALASVRPSFVALAFFTNLLTSFVKGARWRWLFHPRTIRCGIVSLTGLIVLAQAINFIAPGRWGELVRTYMGGEETGVEKSFVLGTIAAEKLLDLVMLALLVVALAPLMALPERVTLQVGPVLIVALTLSVALGVALIGRRFWLGIATDALGRLPDPAASRWQARLRSLVEGVSALGATKAAPAIWGWTVVAWFTAALTNWFLLIAFGLPASWLMATFVLVVLQGGVAVPSTPGKIGVFQYLCVIALSVFGVPAATGFSYGVVLYALVVGTMVVWAAVVLWRQSWNMQRLRDATSAVAETVNEETSGL